MLWPADLTGAERPAYVEALRNSTFVEFEVAVLNLDGDLVGNMSPNVSTGQILVDRLSTRTTRALIMDFDDPTGRLAFSPDSPDEAAVALTHMLQLTVRTWVPALGRYVDAVPFTGPMRSFWRDGATIHVQAHGKELLARRPLGDTVTILAGTPVGDAIRIIMSRIGETAFALPQLDQVVPRTLSLGPGTRPWEPVQRLAQAADSHAYYRGDGALSLRQLPEAPLHTFRLPDDEGDGEIVGAPKISYELGDDFANVVEVLGAPARLGQDRARATVALPEDHPLSPEQFGRGGVPGRYPRTIENHQIQSDDDAERYGQRILRDMTLEVVKPRFTCLPMYHAEEGDFAQMETDELMIPFRLDLFTLPVSTRGRPLMHVGDQQKTTPDRWVA